MRPGTVQAVTSKPNRRRSVSTPAVQAAREQPHKRVLALYYASPDRADLRPDPAEWIVTNEPRWVQPIED
jgi:hypothetical protein